MLNRDDVIITLNTKTDVRNAIIRARVDPSRPRGGGAHTTTRAPHDARARATARDARARLERVVRRASSARLERDARGDVARTRTLGLICDARSASGEE